MSQPQPRTRVPSQDRAVRTRAALLTAAEREFSSKGYAATTARSIAERARTATGSFYQYFTSKDEVLREIAAARQAAVVTRALAMLEGPAVALADGPAFLTEVRRRMRTVVDVVMTYHADDPGLHAVITERRHADPALEAAITTGEHQVVERIAVLLARWGHGGDATATAFVLFGALEGAIHAHVLGRPLVDDVRFVDALVEALLRLSFPVSPVPKEHPWPS